MAQKRKGSPKPSTQQYLPIAEMKQDTVVMKDGTLRAVLIVSSINFELKSEEEQNAIVGSYVSFLNSLNHPIQVVIQSRRLNVDPYLDQLGSLAKAQTNELLKAQTYEYRAYIKELMSLGEIMTKRFYVVIPYSPYGEGKIGFMSQLSKVFSPAKMIFLREQKFLKFKETLDQRVDNISAGLVSMGVTPIRLDTQGLIELYYQTYNPETAQFQKLADLEKMQVEEKEV